MKYPLKYGNRRRSKRAIGLKIACVWGVSLSVALPLFTIASIDTSFVYRLRINRSVGLITIYVSPVFIRLPVCLLLCTIIYRFFDFQSRARDSISHSVCRSVCWSVCLSASNEFYRSVMLLVVYICC